MKRIKFLFFIHLIFPAFVIAQPDSIAPDQTGMRDLTSVDLAKEMVPGWNVGNSLEATGGETNWGNPRISQQLIDSIKAAGFRAIRIPVAWSKFTDTSAYAIDTNFVNRVEQVVNYVLGNDMYAIINCHWDGGWMIPTYGMQDYVNNRLAAMWKQIAIHFRDYDDRLLFAGTNEVKFDYGNPAVEYYTVQNSYNQTFISTVRATGGRNYYRHLVVQGYNTNIDHTVNYFVTPVDPLTNRMLVEVHYYDPYNFALNTGSNITQWGRYATNPAKTETWANEAWADGQFQKMKTKFTDHGYGVILGEYGAISRLNLGSDELNKEYAFYRKYYLEYITHSIVMHDLVPFYWDNGGTGDHAFGIFNRVNGSRAYPDLVEQIVDAADTSYVLNAVHEADAVTLKLYPNPSNNEFTLEVKDMSVSQCQLFDSAGQFIHAIPINRDIITVDARDLKAGVYFIRLETKNGFVNQKLVKD